MAEDGSYRVGVDIGGTFVDCVVLDADGHIASVAKSPNTPEDQSLGVMGALEAAADNLGVALRTLLSSTTGFIHGCTVGTNALLERKGAKTGLITTSGFEDTIFIGRVMQKRAGLMAEEVAHQSRLFKAEPPVVPHALIRGVAERVDAIGEVLCPLDEAGVATAVAELVDQEGAESLAISYLWSFIRPEHEQRTRQIIAQAYPNLYVASSHEVAPVLGEYERTVSAVLTAYLGPAVARYAQRLEERLSESGLSSGLLMMTCRGGLTSVDDACQNPLLTLDSGPVGGAIGGSLFSANYGEDNLICVDMGGTSFDVSLVLKGELVLETIPVVDKYTFYCPKVAIKSIGAGGGSIVSVDATGVPKVGPESAGARPGPAAYGLGGAEPTVTDVDLVLGYLNPDQVLGGKISLDKSKADKAVGRVGQEVGMTTEEMAIGAFTIVNARMADMISKLTIESGHDPREFSLLAYGGASGVHIPFLAQDLHVKSLYVPDASSVFSALGMVRGDVIHTLEHSFIAIAPFTPKERSALNGLIADLEKRVMQQFIEEGWAQDQVRISRSLFMKYRLQVHELPLAIGEQVSEEDVAALQARFEAQYEDIYGQGTGFSQVGVEVVKIRVDGNASPAAPPMGQATEQPVADATAALKGVRDAYFPSLGRFVPAEVYDGGKLRNGNVLKGPCIIERTGDTIVIPNGAQGEVDAYGTIRLDL
ncbi:MAG: N-methylhydantoinase A [Chloroflexi bacterium]|jgi:N-methylhydantoinase A|nr:MAG: N-methylhydantoinase A [Chloroflexota bacterium]